MTDVHVVVPEGIDDPARPSGGNRYDRRVCDELRARGWSVREHVAPGAWPDADPAAHAALGRIAHELPDRALVLLDGLIASAAPEALVAHARRLRQVVLVHMPLGHRPPAGQVGYRRARERAALGAAAAVVVTSAWTRRRLGELYSLACDRVHVAVPGVDRAELAAGSAAGGALLCVAALTRDKGHDVLVDALASTAELRWRCTLVGSLERDPAWAQDVRDRARGHGFDGRVRFAGARVGAELDDAYAAADVLVLASQEETYGMVVAEALAHGLPVIASDVGGVDEALGRGDDGEAPGLLVAPGDARALATALRRWLGDHALRERLRRIARERRARLRGWDATASVVADALARAAR